MAQDAARIDPDLRFGARMLRAYNASAAIIPAFSFVRINDTNSAGALIAYQPNANSMNPQGLLINGAAPIPDAVTGNALPPEAGKLWVAYTGTAPTVGGQVGTVAGAWTASSAQTGFYVNAVDAANSLVQVTPNSSTAGTGAGSTKPIILSQAGSLGVATSYVRDDTVPGLLLVADPAEGAALSHATLIFANDATGLQAKLASSGGINAVADGLSIAVATGTQNGLIVFDANGAPKEPNATIICGEDLQLASGKHLTAAVAGSNNLFASGTPGGTAYTRAYDQYYSTSAAANGTVRGYFGRPLVQITDDVRHYLLGVDLWVQKTVAATKTDTGYMSGLRFQCLRNAISGADDDGTLAAMYGIQVQYGHYNTEAAETPQTTNAYGLHVTPYKKTGTITNAYDVYLAAEPAGGTVTNGWGVYQANSKANYFGGTVDAIGGFKDNSVAGVDGTLGIAATSSGGIITALGTTQVYLTARMGSQQTVTSGAENTIEFDTAEISTAAYNDGTYIFTAPAAGNYQVSAMVNNATGDVFGILRILKNGAPGAGTTLRQCSCEGADQIYATIPAFWVTLVQNDTLRCSYENTDANNDHTVGGGVLIGTQFVVKGPG